MKAYFYLISIFQTLINLLLVIFYNLKSFGFINFKSNDNSEIYLLANGPSLKDNLKSNSFLEKIKTKNIMVFNNFISSKYYEVIKPKFYVLIDNGIFLENQSDRIEQLKIEITKHMIKKTSWNLNLVIPRRFKNSKIIKNIKSNKNIKIIDFAHKPVIGGVEKLNKFFFNFDLAHPHFQNVLIAGIFISLKINFKKIIIFGADHSWHESFSLSSDNKLYLADKHFYSQNKNDRIKKTIYNNEESKMHVEFENIARVFKTYHLINSYAADSNIEILNLSTKTWIDAFKRK